MSWLDKAVVDFTRLLLISTVWNTAVDASFSFLTSCAQEEWEASSITTAEAVTVKRPNWSFEKDCFEMFIV